MKLRDVILVSITNLRGNALRSLLTIMGVAIGIAAIVFLYSLGTGLQKLTIERIAQSAALSSIDVSIGKSLVLKLNDDSVNQFRSFKHVKQVTGIINLPGQVVLNDTATDVVVIGAESSYADLKGLNLKAGTFLDRSTSGQTVRPLVITTETLKLFEITNSREAIGKKVSLNILLGESGTSNDFEKVTREYSIEGVADDSQTLVYVPLDDVKALGESEYTNVKVQVEDPDRIEEVKNAITTIGYNATSVADLIIQIRRVFSIIQAVLAGFGAIALVVASIGMFNTLTIALLERTRDIGIMKAIGARTNDIRRLFLTEALMIGGMGGVCGIILAVLMGTILNVSYNIVAKRLGGDAVQLFSYEPIFLLIVVIFAFVVGLATGVYPAHRASKLNPLKALRYE